MKVLIRRRLISARSLFLLIEAAALLLFATAAQAAIVPIEFNDGSHHFSNVSTGTLHTEFNGSLHADGAGVLKSKLLSTTITKNFTFIDPKDHVAITKNINSKRAPGGNAEFDLVAGTSAPTLQDIDNLDVVFNSSFLVIGIQQVDIPVSGITSPLFFNIGGGLTSLSFSQTGGSVLTGADGSGTYSVDGVLNGVISSLTATLSSATRNLDNINFSIPYTLTGTWNASGAPGQSTGSLDGSLNVTMPFAVTLPMNTAMVAPSSFTMSATVTLVSTLTVADAYHLAWPVPEPGSVVLLFLGLIGALPLCWQRLRRAG